MKKSSNQTKIKGFSLIEVLIAIVVFSFALLGIAGIMTISVRSNHNGYLRSQAVLLANDMSARMRANVTGLWQGAYNGTAPNDITTFCNNTSRCDRAQLAQLDMETWGMMLNQLLPNGTGTINCETPTPPVGIMSSGLWIASPPFTGICQLQVTWNESNEQGSQQQTLDLVIQP